MRSRKGNRRKGVGNPRYAARIVRPDDGWLRRNFRLYLKTCVLVGPFQYGESIVDMPGVRGRRRRRIAEVNITGLEHRTVRCDVAVTRKENDITESRMIGFPQNVARNFYSDVRLSVRACFLIRNGLTDGCCRLANAYDCVCASIDSGATSPA